jgi:hypothetical protein
VTALLLVMAVGFGNCKLNDSEVKLFNFTKSEQVEAETLATVLEVLALPKSVEIYMD